MYVVILSYTQEGDTVIGFRMGIIVVHFSKLRRKI